MPYIESRRIDIDDAMIDLKAEINTYGKANYAITKLLLDSFEPTSYNDFNALIGVLECAKLEFYRRAVATYEDQKIKENGDVYV